MKSVTGKPETSTGEQAQLPIREISLRTGVNPVTLRAWERRYGLLVPVRSGKGHRLYSEADVRRVQEILDWLARGVAIGKVRPLLERGEELAEVGAVSPEDSWSEQVSRSVALIGRFAARELQQQLEDLLGNYPLPLVMDRWLVPLHKSLNRQRKFGADIAQNYFWQSLSDQLAIAVRSGQKGLHRSRAQRILLVTFAGAEQQAFAQLFHAVLLTAGIETVRLGPDAELSELAYAEEKLGVHATVCYSHNALPMAILSIGLQRALRAMTHPVWFAGGFVELQRRDLRQLATRHKCRLLSGSCAETVAELREQLT